MTTIKTPRKVVIWEQDSRSADHEIPRILWKPKVHYRVHKTSPPDPILSQTNQVYPTSLRPILILSFHLRIDTI
jgi:hypothetical protein